MLCQLVPVAGSWPGARGDPVGLCGCWPGVQVAVLAWSAGAGWSSCPGVPAWRGLRGRGAAWPGRREAGAGGFLRGAGSLAFIGLAWWPGFSGGRGGLPGLDPVPVGLPACR